VATADRARSLPAGARRQPSRHLASTAGILATDTNGANWTRQILPAHRTHALAFAFTFVAAVTAPLAVMSS
jgi:hypothetical protein